MRSCFWTGDSAISSAICCTVLSACQTAVRVVRGTAVVSRLKNDTPDFRPRSRPFGEGARRARHCKVRMAAARGKASQPPSSVSGAQKQRLNDLFQPQAPLFKQPRGGHARRSSISAEAQAIAVGRRGSIVAQAGVAAMAALKGASSSSPSGGARAGANAGLPHLSPSSTSTRSCEEVTRRQGFLFDHDYARIMRETGYGRVEVYDLFMQFKALSALSSSPEGVDKDTFVRLTPTLMMEDSAFVGRVFDLLDVDGSGTIGACVVAPSPCRPPRPCRGARPPSTHTHAHAHFPPPFRVGGVPHGHEHPLPLECAGEAQAQA